MGVAEEGQGGPLLLGGVDQGIDAVVVHVVQVTVGDEGLHRAQLHRVPGRGDGGNVAVAAYAVQGDFGESLMDGGGVPVMVAQVDDHIRAAAAHRFQAQGDVGMGVGKDGSFHGIILS